MRRLALLATTVALVGALLAGTAGAGRTLRADLRPLPDERVVTVLLIGSDKGLPRRGNPLRGNADAIHLVAVDTKRLRATIVDIPRDSLIGGTKVNAHLARGGPHRLRSALSAYTGVRIDHHVLTTFGGFAGIVRSMGGLKVQLARPVRDSAARASLPAGEQRLKGSEAVAFSRARKTLANGDFDRTRNQGKLLRAAHRQLRTEARDLPSLTRLTAAVARNTSTDLTAPQMLRLAALAVRIKPSDVRQDSLSGPLGYAGYQSVVHLRSGNTFARLRRGAIGP